MNKAFEKILERLEEEKAYLSAYNDGLDKAKEIVNEVAEEYRYLSQGFDSGLLKRIADYFSSVYEGDDKTAPKMELSVDDLRYIANLHVEKCRLQAEINNLKKSNGECNNGWIPCSERMPEEDGMYLTTSKIYFTPDHVDEIDNYIGIKISCYSTRFGWDDEVFAWQPLPVPYQPKGE